MNGAGEGNIIFGDGLENAPEKGIENGTFDILVANPPYSVKDFKQHLQLKNNSFTLLDRIGLNGSEIETLFVERIGQLLKPQGIAAVILPSSILSNDSNIYMGAREQFLENFYIRAIVALGSKTFGATGTNTVIMFLEKFNEPPKQTDLSSDSVEAIMSRQDLTDWDDKEVISQYMKQIEVPESIYSAFLNKTLTIDELNDSDYFRMYVTAFADSTEAKNLTKTKAYQKLAQPEKKQAYLSMLYDYINQVEREKLFYFALVYKQTTVIIKAPTDNKGQKDFLGYDWSNRKGNEGIQITAPGGKMYDDSNREATGTLAHAIKDSFDGKVPAFTEEQEKYGSVVLTKDMLDFSRVTFNKAIRLNPPKNISFNSKYSLRELGSILTLEYGKALKEADRIPGNFPVMGSNGEVGMHNDFLIEGPAIIVGRKGSAGSITWENRNCYPIDTTYYVSLKGNDVKLKYIYYILQQIDFDEIVDKMGVPGLNRENVYKIKIPVPPTPIQQQIIDACDKIDAEYESTRMSIEEYRKKIEDLFNELDVISNRGGDRMSLADSNKFDVSIGKRVLNKQLSPEAEIPVYSANVKEPFGYINDLLITDFSVPSVLWGIDGDWMTSYMPENERFYPTDHCGVLRCKTDDVNPRYLTHILKREGAKMGFSRSYRASIDRVQSINFSVVGREVQDKTVDEIKTLESQIRQAEVNLQKLNGKTSEILHHYLD